MIIEIATHGSSLHRRRERFIIRTPEQKDAEIPAEKVDAILIASNAIISTAAIKLCVERQIQLVMTSWYGNPIARMWTSSPGRQTQIRRQQYMNVDTHFAFKTTQSILLEKIIKQKKFLLDLKYNRVQDSTTDELKDAVSFINSVIAKIKQVQYTKNFASHFLGYEGSCAVRYFEMISKCLPKKWQFSHRTQNPGLDPFNASLNYMYGMAYSSIEKIIILSGLDPNAGFYHMDNYAKPTLVFDLIEPQRPIIDRTLVYMFNKKIVRDNWFTDTKDAVFSIEITKQGRKALIDAYDKKCLKIIEKCIWRQCRKMTGELLNLDICRSATT